MELKNWLLDSFSQKIPWKLSDIRSNGSLCNAPLRVGEEANMCHLPSDAKCWPTFCYHYTISGLSSYRKGKLSERSLSAIFRSFFDGIERMRIIHKCSLILALC